MNKAILMGNVGVDPRMRFVQTRPVAEFTLATNEPAYRTAAGVEIPERTEWHNIVMWDAQAEFAEKYIRKGTRLYVEGRLRTREYEDKFKIRRRITEIHVDRVELLGRSSASQ